MGRIWSGGKDRDGGGSLGESVGGYRPGGVGGQDNSSRNSHKRYLLRISVLQEGRQV